MDIKTMVKLWDMSYISEYLAGIKDDKKRELAVKELYNEKAAKLSIKGSIQEQLHSIRVDLNMAEDRAKVIIQQQKVRERKNQIVFEKKKRVVNGIAAVITAVVIGAPVVLAYKVFTTDWLCTGFECVNEKRISAGEKPYASIEEWEHAKWKAEYERNKAAIREAEELNKKRFLAEREAAKKRMYKEAAWIAEDMLRKQRGW